MENNLRDVINFDADYLLVCKSDKLPNGYRILAGIGRKGYTLEYKNDVYSDLETLKDYVRNGSPIGTYKDLENKGIPAGGPFVWRAWFACAVAHDMGKMKNDIKLFFCQYKDGAQDERCAEIIHGDKAGMEEDDGEDNGRQGFDGAQETGFGGGDVFDAAEVTAKGYDGAENDDIGISDGGGIVPKAAELPGRTEGHQCQSP